MALFTRRLSPLGFTGAVRKLIAWATVGLGWRALGGG